MQRYEERDREEGMEGYLILWRCMEGGHVIGRAVSYQQPTPLFTI
jgi:hypothetical protein